MYELFAWLLLIPVAFMAMRFWVGVFKWLVRHKQTLGKRAARVRSAFAEGDEE